MIALVDDRYRKKLTYRSHDRSAMLVKSSAASKSSKILVAAAFSLFVHLLLVSSTMLAGRHVWPTIAFVSGV